MSMNRALFKKQLQDGLNTVFGMEYDRYPEEWREFLDVESSDKAYEEDVLMVGLGPAMGKAEGAGVQYDMGAEAWTARYVHETVALAFAITEEAIEDGRYGKLSAQYVKGLARSQQHTKNVKGANVLNFGFDANVKGGDGKPLFATDHPLWIGGTASNTFATPADLAEASLEDAEIQIGGFVDDRNMPAVIKPRKLIVHRSNKFNAQRLLFSSLRPGTGDNDLNAINALSSYPGGYAVNHFLTDPKAWFIKTDCPDGLKHMIRKALQRGMEGDFETGNMRYKTRQRYTQGFTNWRGAFAATGGGA